MKASKKTKVIDGNDINVWRVDTVSLLTQVLDNPGTATLSIPLNILGKILAQVAERAIIINDKELNKLMIRLTLYESASPGHKDYVKTKEYLES